MLADNVEAFFDTWIVGDNFVKEANSSLQTIKNKAILQKRDPPYIFQCFNISVHYGSAVNNPINRMLSPLAEAFNEMDRLPKYIMIIPDVDIVKSIPDWAGASVIIGALLHYIIKGIDVMVEHHLNDLMSKKPGAVYEQQPYPKIIWVQMLKRDLTSVPNLPFALRSKFNNILEDCLMDGKWEDHHIISIEVDPVQYDRQGFLSSSGKEDFWREIDKGMKRFDSGDITLRP